MALPNFLKNKQSNEKKKGKSKTDFREKCTVLLAKIKELNEERYQDLQKIFQQKYDKLNISKKLVAGFYAQLVSEYNILRVAAGKSIVKTKKRVASHLKVKEVTKKLKAKANQVNEAVKEKSTEAVKKATKKTAKKVENKAAKKTTKKVEKKTAKKTTKKVEKKAVKKTAKKVEKKVAKKTAKKVTKKKKA